MVQLTVLPVLPVLPWTLGAIATVLVVALGVPPNGRHDGDLRAGPSPVVRLPIAVLAGLLAVAAVALARLGPASELRNPVPAVVVGLGWPLLLLLPPLLGPPARRLLARPGPGSHDVRPAVLAAMAVVLALVLPTGPTRPDVVATSIAAYLLAVTVVAVALGRVHLAERFEVLGLLARWAALGPELVRWVAPRGAGTVLAVVLGGAWFERYERTAAWRARLPETGDVVLGLAVAVLAAGLAAVLLQRTAGTAAAAVLLPLALATAVAGATRRALISAQLLLDQVQPGVQAVDPDPLGVVGGQALALALVVLGGSLSAAVLARRLGEGAERLPGVGVLLLLTGGSAALVLQP